MDLVWMICLWFYWSHNHLWLVRFFLHDWLLNRIKLPSIPSTTILSIPSITTIAFTLSSFSLIFNNRLIHNLQLLHQNLHLPFLYLLKKINIRLIDITPLILHFLPIPLLNILQHLPSSTSRTCQIQMKHKESNQRHTQQPSHHGNNNDNCGLVDRILWFGDGEDDHVDDT